MTVTEAKAEVPRRPPSGTDPVPPELSQERPPGRSKVDRTKVIEFTGSAAAALAVVWLPLHLAGQSAPFGLLICWIAAFATLYGTVSWRLHGILVAKDRLAAVYVWSGASIALLALVLIIALVVGKGFLVVFKGFPHFLTGNLVGVGPTDPYTKAGMRHAITGTLQQVGLATGFTVPVAIGTAIYLNEIPGRLATVVRTIVDAMSGIPSIIAGLFVYLLWVRPRGTGGYSGFAASMAIAILMLPTITRTAEEVLRIVPGSLREASLALGAPEWRTVTRVVLPTARAGLATAIILGVARAVGETAPVIFTAHGSVHNNANPFSGPQADLPLTVYQLIKSPIDNYVSEAWGGALLLVMIVLTLFSLARILGSGGRSQGRAMQGTQWLLARARRPSRDPSR